MNIKNISTVILVLSLSISSISAQYATMHKGDQLISASIGLFNPEEFAFDFLGFSGSGEPSPSFNLHFQHSISDHVAIGAFGNYYRVNASSLNRVEDLLTDFSFDIVGDLLGNLACSILGNCGELDANERLNVFTLGGSLTYHTQISDKIDTYASTNLGYSINRRKSFTGELLDILKDQTGLGVKIPNFVYYTSVGARYYVTPDIGIYGEAGYGNSHLFQLGLTYKLSKVDSAPAKKRNRA